MSIATYAELRTAVENWLDHTLFTARVPEFIALFEAAANRRLRVRQQESLERAHAVLRHGCAPRATISPGGG